jgi:hypothetical protein
MTRDGSTADDGGTHQPVGSDLHRWVATLVDGLGLDPDAVDVEAVLDLAREVATAVARPAVPLTAYLVGCAVGAGTGDQAAFERVSAKVGELVRVWTSEVEA